MTFSIIVLKERILKMNVQYIMLLKMYVVNVLKISISIPPPKNVLPIQLVPEIVEFSKKVINVLLVMLNFILTLLIMNVLLLLPIQYLLLIVLIILMLLLVVNV